MVKAEIEDDTRLIETGIIELLCSETAAQGATDVLARP